jgi:hypothetical protein
MSLAIALGAAGVVLLIWRISAGARNKKHAKAVEAGSAEIKVVVRPHKDLGTHQLEFSAPAATGFDVRLQPVPDSGEQVMEQGIIIHKRKEGNDG